MVLLGSSRVIGPLAVPVREHRFRAVAPAVPAPAGVDVRARAPRPQGFPPFTCSTAAPSGVEPTHPNSPDNTHSQELEHHQWPSN